jgi:hypothetical protein
VTSVTSQDSVVTSVVYSASADLADSLNLQHFPGSFCFSFEDHGEQVFVAVCFGEG